MPSRISILIIPPEIRLIIFKEYFAIRGGYILDPHSAKLKAANGMRIEFSLRLTCKLIAHETAAAPFYANTIHVSTICSDYIRSAAGRFDLYLRDLFIAEEWHFWDKQHLIDHEIHDAVVKKFPAFKPIMDLLLTHNSKGERVNIDQYRISLNDMGQIPSIRRPAITYTLLLFLQRHGVRIDDRHYRNQDEFNQCLKGNFLRLSELYHEPWTIPSWDHLDKMEIVLGEERSYEQAWLQSGRNTRRYRFSATAAAIFFLKSIPYHLRQHIRHMVLREDYASAAYPECHARGLIPFCKENTALRIERHVNVWRAMFDGRCREFLHAEHQMSTISGGRLVASDICYVLTRWIMETCALLPAGMPSKSLVVILDANPSPRLFSQIFQEVVQRNARMFKAGLTEPSPAAVIPVLAHGGLDRFVDFPLVIKRLTDGESIIQCNFDPGEPWGILGEIKLDIPSRHVPYLSSGINPKPPTWEFLLQDTFWGIHRHCTKKTSYFSRSTLPWE